MPTAFKEAAHRDTNASYTRVQSQLVEHSHAILVDNSSKTLHVEITPRQPKKMVDIFIRQPNQRKSDNTDVVNKRNHVRDMMKGAWDIYVKYAWGYDEVKPHSKGVSDRHGSRVPMGTSIVDSMDTLYIMGLDKEFEAGKKWIEESFDFNLVHDDVSVFETNIRFVGG